MKTLSFFFAAILLCSNSFAQVEAGKVKNTLAGKNSSLAIPFTKISLDNFQITFNLYSAASDQGGGLGSTGVATVTVRSGLNQVDQPLAQQIVDEAYLYFVEQWKKRGVEVVCASKDELEASKKYSKAASKGDGQIISGGAVEINEKNTHNISAYPAGTNIAFSGTSIMPANGNAVHLPPDYKNNFFWTSFGATVDFISFKTAKIGSTASVKGSAKLTSVPILGVSAWEKTKLGAYMGSQELDGTSDYFDDMKEENMTLFGSSGNSWQYYANPEKYKAGVLELLKKGMDDLFADYDEVVAKERG